MIRSRKPQSRISFASNASRQGCSAIVHLIWTVCEFNSQLDWMSHWPLDLLLLPRLTLNASEYLQLSFPKAIIKVLYGLFAPPPHLRTVFRRVRCRYQRPVMSCCLSCSAASWAPLSGGLLAGCFPPPPYFHTHASAPSVSAQRANAELHKHLSGNYAQVHWEVLISRLADCPANNSTLIGLIFPDGWINGKGGLLRLFWSRLGLTYLLIIASIHTSLLRSQIMKLCK